MQIAGHAPNEREQVRYGFKGGLFVGESSMGPSRHQDSDKLAIGERTRRQACFLPLLQSFEELWLWRLRQNGL